MGHWRATILDPGCCHLGKLYDDARHINRRYCKMTAILFTMCLSPLNTIQGCAKDHLAIQIARGRWLVCHSFSPCPACLNNLRYGAAYNLASAVMQPMAGKLYASLNTKWTFMGFLFVFEIGSLLCGVATSSAMLIVGRAVAGIGGGGIYVGAFTILTLIAPMHKRAFFTGLLTGLAQLGLVCGPLIGGVSGRHSTSFAATKIDTISGFDPVQYLAMVCAELS